MSASLAPEGFSGTHAQEAARSASFRVGVGSYAFRWNVDICGMTPAALLDAAARLGAQVVQLQDNLPVADLPASALRQLAAQAESLGLALELGIRGSQPERLCAGLSVARRLNARLMRVVLAAPGWKPQPGELLASLLSLLPALRAEGVALAIENHFDLRPAELAALVEEVNDPLVGVCLDPLNAYTQLVSPAETIACLAPFALSVHVKDARITRHNTGFYLHGCPLGQGLFEVAPLLAALRAAQKAPALLLEAWMDRLEDPAATCAQELAWVDGGLKYLYETINDQEKRS